MVVRGAGTVAPKLLRRNYIKDDYIALGHGKAVREETQFHMPNCPSGVGRTVYIYVFCDTPPGSPEEKLETLVGALLGTLPRRYIYCSNDTPPGTGPLSINDLERHAFLKYHGGYYILPDRMEQAVDGLLNTQLMRACDILAKARLDLAHEENDPSFNRPQAVQQALQQLADVFAVQTLDSFVFDNGIYSSAFNQAKRAFFDVPNVWQLAKDYQGVRTPDGRVVDIQHLMVGLDVLRRSEEARSFEKIPIGTNWAASTWSGDIGAGAADMLLSVDQNWERRNPKASFAERADHYFQSRASEWDLLADVDVWALNIMRENDST